MAKSVRTSIGGGGNRSSQIHIDRDNPRCTCSSSRQGLNTRTGAKIGDGFPREVEPTDECCKVCWCAVVARIIDGRTNGQLKPRESRQPSPATLQEEIVAKDMKNVDDDRICRFLEYAPRWRPGYEQTITHCLPAEREKISRAMADRHSRQTFVSAVIIRSSKRSSLSAGPPTRVVCFAIL